MSTDGHDDCIDIFTELTDTFTIDTFDTLFTSSILVSSYPNCNIGVGAMGSSGGNYITTNNAWNGTFTSHTSPSSLSVSGDAEFEGDVKIKGVSISKALDDINKRLAILVPDPAKLEHFAALKKAYDHYKVLEALCELPTETKE